MSGRAGRRVTLAFKDWPEADRALWHALTTPAGPLDDGGALAHVRASTHRTLTDGYARWLGWLGREDPAALELAPLARATLVRLRRWTEARPELAPMSRQFDLARVLRVLGAAAPDADWSAQRRLSAALRREATSTMGARKAGRILSSAVLLEAGLRLAGPMADAAPDARQVARSRRDGAMVAFLALMPIRARAFVHLTLGRSVRVKPGGIRIVLDPALTKTGLPWEAPVPPPVEPLLRRYILEVRPVLLGQGRDDDGRLWIGDRGRPYDGIYFGRRIRELTEALIGVKVSPHFFRDAAATTLARSSPEAARLTRAVLGHASHRTAHAHYNHARALEAGRDYHAVLANLIGDIER